MFPTSTTSSMPRRLDRAAVPAATLYALPASHPARRWRWRSGSRGSTTARVDMPPGRLEAPAVAPLRRDDRAGVEFSDGEKVLGSREILRALEHRAPEPHLLPADARERPAVEEAERWGDEVLQPLARGIAWAALVRDTSAMTGYAVNADLPVPDALVAAHGAGRRARLGVLQRGERPRRPLRPDQPRLPPRPRGPLDREGRRRRLGDPERRRPPDRLRRPAAAHDRGPAPRIEGRPCAREAMRRFPDYPGRVPAGALPRAWLDARPPAEI